MRKNYSFIVDLADMLAEEITETFKYSPDLKNHKFYKDLIELSSLQKKLSDMNESFSILSLEQLAYCHFQKTTAIEYQPFQEILFN